MWPDESGNPWKKNVKDLGYEVLFVSQFTLYARMKGTKPDYSLAMVPDEAKDLYKLIHQIAKKKYNSQKNSRWGIRGNDGPVTITLDFDKPEQKKADPNSKKSKKRESST